MAAEEERAGSLSFIGLHEGNITGVSLQEGCDNTAAAAAHYRRVPLACHPPLAFLTFSALSLAAKDPLLTAERERE